MTPSTSTTMTPLRIAGITLALLLCVGCNSNVMLTLPGTLEGVWTTDDPRFQDRSLELSSSFVIIITGHDDPASVQFVDKVESEPAAEGTSMTVYSTDYLEGAHYQMRLLFSPANGGELRIQNEGRVWKHAAP